MVREVVGTRQCRVHNSLPLFWRTFCRTFLDMELQLFPVRVDHRVDIVVALRSAVQAESEAARVIGQIDGWPNSIPRDILPPEPAAAQGRMSFPERNHALEETKHVRVRA